MMNTGTENIKVLLEKRLRLVSVNDVIIKGGIIEYISIEKESIGSLKFQRLHMEDAPALHDFYFNGLSARSRNLFPPYPLFSPPLSSVEELTKRIADWEKEDDWTVLKLVKAEQIIGMGLLKRFRTERPVSGLAIREEYQEKGLGFLIQTIIIEQARILNLEKLYATLAPDNVASIRVHQKCGFKQTGKMVPHFVYKNGVKVIDRHDIEMVLQFSYGETRTLF